MTILKGQCVICEKFVVNLIIYDSGAETPLLQAQQNGAFGRYCPPDNNVFANATFAIHLMLKLHPLGISYLSSLPRGISLHRRLMFQNPKVSLQVNHCRA